MLVALCNICSVTAASEDESVGILNSIGIIKGEIEDIKTEEKLSRANAALWMYNLLGGTEEYDYSVFEDVTSGTKTANAIMGLYKMNIIAGYGAKFRPNDNITPNEFLTMLCNTIGYSKLAESRGGYPVGVMQVMSELGVTGGVNVGSDSLTLGQAARLVMNALKANALEFVIIGDSVSYKKSDKQVMNEFLDLYLVKGLVTANSRTSLYKANGGKKNSITIGNDTYTAGLTNADDLLGLYVEAYVHIDSDDEGTVVAAVKRENMYSELSICASDIEASSTRTNVVYNDNDRIRNKRISATADIIYNGVAYPDAAVSEIYPDYGEIRLIDSNNDNEFDIVFVTAYIPVISGGVDTVTGKIINKYKGSGFESIIDIDENDEIAITDIFGESMELSDITENTVAFIKKPKTGDTHRYEIVISQKSIKGKISEISAEDTFSVGDNEYKLSDAAKNAIAGGLIDELRIGKQYTLYFDIYDEVIFYELEQESEGYGYIKRAYLKRRDGDYIVEMFCTDNEWKTFKLRDKIRCDGVTVKASDFVDSAAVKEIVKYELDGNGLLRSIEYPILTSLDDPDYKQLTKQKAFTKVNINNERWLTNTKSYEGKYYTPNIEYVFSVPADGNESDFKITSFSASSEVRYTLSMYELDEFSYGKIALIEATDTLSINYRDSLIVVDKVINAYVNEEIVSVVSGFMNGQNVSFTGKDVNTFSGLKCGDVIRTKYNYGNKAVGYDLVHSFGTESSDISVISAWNKISEENPIKGIASKVDYRGGRIRMDGILDGISWQVRSNTTITVYDSFNKKVKSGTINDLTEGDYIIIRHHGGEFLELLIIKK